MVKVLTNSDLGNAVLSQVKEKMPGLMDFLDYASVSKLKSEIDEIYDDEFDIKGDLQFGSSEGIYLDMYIEGEFGENGETKKSKIVVFKTLEDSFEALMRMSEIQAIAIWEGRAWIRENRDQLSRRGWSVKKERDDNWSYLCYTEESLKKHILEGCSYVTDNKTGDVLTKDEIAAIVDP